MVLGNHGGYKVSYFADIRHGERVTTVGADGWQIIDASLQYTFFPSGLTGDAHWVFGGAVGTTAVLAYYAWRAVLRPVLNWHRPQERLKVYLSVWILAYSLLYVVSKTWFWRQGFPMVVPMSLLVAVVARDSWRDFKHDRSLVALNYIPQLVLIMSMLFYSPQVRGGLDESFHQTRLHRNGILTTLLTMTEALGPNDTVHLAVSIEKKYASTLDFWGRQVRDHKGPRFLTLAHTTREQSTYLDPQTGTFDGEVVQLRRDLTFNDSTAKRIGYRPGHPLERTTEPTTNYLFLLTATQAQLVPITLPTRVPIPTTSPIFVQHPVRKPKKKKKKKKKKKAAVKEARPSEALQVPVMPSTVRAPAPGPAGELDAD